jgi:hypothetical protein
MMATTKFSNQTAEQVMSHLQKYLGSEKFNLSIDTFAKVAEIRVARQGEKGESKKKDRIRGQMEQMQPKKRKQVMSAKRREKPKLKTVRNGRMITLKGYTGFQ